MRHVRRFESGCAYDTFWCSTGVLHIVGEPSTFQTFSNPNPGWLWLRAVVAHAVFAIAPWLRTDPATQALRPRMVADLPDVVPEQLGGSHTSSRSPRSFDVFEGGKDNVSDTFL